MNELTSASSCAPVHIALLSDLRWCVHGFNTQGMSVEQPQGLGRCDMGIFLPLSENLIDFMSCLDSALIGDSAWSNTQNLALLCRWLWVGFQLSIMCWSSVWGIFCSLFCSLVFRLWGWHEKGEERAVSQQGQWCCTSYIIFVECFAFSSNTKGTFWLPPRHHRHFMVPSLAHGVKGTFPCLCERLLAHGGWFSWSCRGAGCQDPEIKRCRKGVEMWQA